MVTTFLSSAVVTAIAVAAGGMLAWYLRTVKRTAVKAVLWVAVLAPIWMGTVVKNYAIVLLVAKEGALNDLLGLFGIGPVSILYTTTTVIIGMVYTMLPYAVFSLYAVLVSIDESLLKAAESMGASRIGALRTVVLPLAMPGILASSALVFAISIGFYITPVLLGGAQTPFMATVIDDNIFNYFNYPLAAAASVILLAVAVLTVGLALALVGRERLVRAAA
jgi:putative spermidine/putrescine transport system permease protein